MKIFFTASHEGKKYFENYYKKIAATIKELGYEQMEDDVLTVSTAKFFENLEKGGKQTNTDLYKRKMKSIQEADICVYECSINSLSLGFLIEKTLDLNKPTVVLYLKDNIPYFLLGANEEKLILKSYNDDDLKQVLKQALLEAQSMKDKRFNFFIGPELLSYLDKVSKARGITKSTFIRNLLLDHMKKNK